MSTRHAPILLITAILLASCGDDDTKAGHQLFTQDPFAAPTDALAGQSVDGCTIYQEETCDAGTAKRCNVYDTTSSQFVATPDPVTHRALLYERRYDLYHSPDGMTAERLFVAETPPGTPEADWGADSNFAAHWGLGDSAIWSGIALNGYLMRYLVTGTEVDYQRLETKVRQALTLFDVTGIPGYLARYHFLDLPTGAPNSDEHAFRYDVSSGPHRHTDHIMGAPQSVPDLPTVYLDGVADAAGTVWPGTPMWAGRPSIDQYSGMTTSLPAAYSLLRDEGLKSRIATHLTCYLKRLQRVELVNLKANPNAANLASSILSHFDNQLEPDDINFNELNSLVFYVLPQTNSLNTDSFDASCPATIATTASRVIDASAHTFEADLLTLLFDIDSGESERANGINHYYVPNARGPDAVHLMYLAAIGYQFTGDEMYRDFAEKTLMQDMQSVAVAHVFASVLEPRWCRKYYVTNIGTGPLWAFINILADSELKTEMQRVMHEEAWLKDAKGLGHARFAAMVAGVVPPEIAVDHDEAVAEAVMRLETFVGDGGVTDDPRRNVNVDPDVVVSQMPADTVVDCPSEEMVSACETGPTLFGIPLEGWTMRSACTGAANECVLDDGQCTPGLASKALPIALRTYSDFMWQRNPWQIGRTYADAGRVQSPGVDLVESYWLARYYGLLDAADGQVLAWEDVGSCP